MFAVIAATEASNRVVLRLGYSGLQGSPRRPSSTASGRASLAPTITTLDEYNWPHFSELARARSLPRNMTTRSIASRTASIAERSCSLWAADIAVEPGDQAIAPETDN